MKKSVVNVVPRLCVVGVNLLIVDRRKAKILDGSCKIRHIFYKARIVSLK